MISGAFPMLEILGEKAFKGSPLKTQGLRFKASLRLLGPGIPVFRAPGSGFRASGLGRV